MSCGAHTIVLKGVERDWAGDLGRATGNRTSSSFHLSHSPLVSPCQTKSHGSAILSIPSFHMTSFSITESEDDALQAKNRGGRGLLYSGRHTRKSTITPSRPTSFSPSNIPGRSSAAHLRTPNRRCAESGTLFSGMCMTLGWARKKGRDEVR